MRVIYRCVGFDPKGFPRTLGESPLKTQAEANAMEEATALIARDSSKGPLALWRFEDKGSYVAN